MARQKSMFYTPARHKKLGEIVTIESPSKAREAARRLLRMFRKAKRRDVKRRIKWAAVLAANRSRAAAKKRDLSRKEKRELRQVAEIYEKAYKKMELD